MYSRYPDELTCDMAETYGIFDIKRVPVQLLATLAVGLRDNSRVKMAMTQTPVRDETVLLAMIADYVHWIQWSMTQAAQDGISVLQTAFKFGNPNTIIKRAVEMLGYPVGRCRSPFNYVPEEGVAAIRKILDDTKALGLC